VLGTWINGRNRNPSKRKTVTLFTM